MTNNVGCQLGQVLKRVAAFCLAAITLAACHRHHDVNRKAVDRSLSAKSPVGAAQVSGLAPRGPITRSKDKPSTDEAWRNGLIVGVNGPIPKIVVDQFGYRTRAAKIAVIRDPQLGYDKSASFTPGTKYQVVNKASGTIVKEGTPVPWNHGVTDLSSGDKAWWFDFSDVLSPGTYFVIDVERGVRSVEFEIDDAVYRNVLKHAVRTFFYQRAGFAKTAEAAGPDWADGASHLSAGQDSEAHAWLAKADAGKIRDLRGGWFDAGDYNKYTSWTARNVIVLLRAFEETPSAFGDDFGIEESGNGVSDILDEVKWALDWLLRMQNPDGSLLCVQGLASASPPSAATGPSYYGPETTAASLAGAAAFAYASKVYSATSEPALKTFGFNLAGHAVRAWKWANSNPKVNYFNNDDLKQPGSAGLAAGQQEMSDTERVFAKFEAAVYLYELTHDEHYKDYVESNYGTIAAESSPNQWNTDRQEALLYYSKLGETAPNVKSAIVTQFVSNVVNNADQMPMVTGDKDPYRAPIKDYVWGSNKSKATQSRIYQLLARCPVDTATMARADSAAEEYIHYIHGVNPLGLVYMTNMKGAGAENSARTMFHNWFADGHAKWDEKTDTAPGPAPGFLVGGPNPAFSLDSCCSASFGTAAYHCYGATKYALCNRSYEPPLKQPDQKSYLQFNSGWPANSWAVTEPSTGYQAQYIRVVATYAR